MEVLQIWRRIGVGIEAFEQGDENVAVVGPFEWETRESVIDLKGVDI